MPYPEQITVHAVIPHEDDPDLHLVDDRGQYPSRLHEHGSGTYEGTFRALGKAIIGRTLSTDLRLADLEESNMIVYRAKPISRTIDVNGSYEWRQMLTD